MDPCGEESVTGLGHFRARGRDEEAFTAKIGPRKLGNSSVNGRRGTDGARGPDKRSRMETDLGKKLGRRGWMGRLIIFKLLVTSRGSFKRQQRNKEEK